MPGRRLSPEQRREEIMAVGLEVFASAPFSEFSVHEIARRAGVSRALFYHYFPTKQDLAREIVAYEISQVEQLAGEENVDSIISAYISYVAQRPMGYRALHVGALTSDPVIAKAIRASQEHFEAVLMMLLGLSPSSPEAQFTLRIWTNLMIATCLEWLDRPEISREHVVAKMTSALHALLPASS